MFTLKIQWQRYAEQQGSPPTLQDESTLFVLADQVEVHAALDESNPRSHDQIVRDWSGAGELGDYLDFTEGLTSSEDRPSPSYHPGRLIRTDLAGESRWWLCSRAWLLGPTGQTIERIAP